MSSLRMKYNIYVSIFILGLIVNFATAITLVINNQNSHMYGIVDTDIASTFEEALVLASTIEYPGYNGYLLVLDDLDEVQFLSTYLGVDNLNVGNKDVWLGIEPLDANQLNWGWINGSTRGQSVYTSIPQRCYLYCGDFNGNSDISKPYLWYTQTANESLQVSFAWNAADATTKKFVILEFEPQGRMPVIQLQEVRSRQMTISNIPDIEDPSLAILFTSESSYHCSIISQTAESVTCEFDSDPQYDAPMMLKIQSGSLPQSRHYFRYNSPWISSYFNSSMESFRFYGYNFQTLNDQSTYQILTINTNLVTVTYNNVPNGPGFFEATLYMQEQDVAYPITLDYTTYQGYRYHAQINRPAVRYPDNQLYYSSYPGTYDFQTAVKLSSKDNIFYNTGNLSLVDSLKHSSFISATFFQGANFNIWTQLTKIGSDYFFFDAQYMGPVKGNVNGPRFYFNSTDQSVYGVDLSTNLQLPFVSVYGLMKGSIASVTPTQVSIGDTVTVVFSDNFFYPQSEVTFITQTDPPFETSIELNFATKSVLFPAPQLTYPSFVEILVRNQEPNAQQSRLLNVSLSYFPPVVISVSATKNVVSIVGNNFGDPISISGLNCMAIEQTILGTITCEMSGKPDTFYEFNMTCGSFTIEKLNVTSGTYVWINSITPDRISVDSQEVLFEIYNYDGTSTIEITESNYCSNVVLINTTFYSCLPPAFSGEFTFYPRVIMTDYVSGEAFINFAAFEVDEFVQDNSVVTLKGRNFDLYKDGWTFSVGGSAPANINYVSENTTLFTFSTANQNGDFKITSQGGFSISYSKTWKPVILNHPNSLEASNNILLQVLFFTSTDKAYLSGYELQLQGNNGLEFTYTCPPFAGTQQLRLESGVDFTNISVSFIAPVTTKVEILSDYKLVITGKALGFSDNTTYPTVPLVIPYLYGLTLQPNIIPFSFNYTTAVYILPKNARSGNYYISTSGLNTDSAIIDIPYQILSISKPPVVGGKLTITGNYLSFVSYQNQPTYDLFIGSTKCEDAKFLSTDYDPYQIECSAPRGTGYTNLTLASTITQLNESTEMSYQPPSVSSTTSTVYHVSGLITVFGENFANTSVVVTISNGVETAECQNATSNIEGTMITCQYDSSIARGKAENETLDVFVSVDKLVFNSKVFLYDLQNYDCGGNNCSGNGDCINNVCQCYQDWTGDSCDQPQVLQPLIVAPPQPDQINITLSTKDSDQEFKISVHSIREVLDTGAVSDTISIQDIKWTQVSVNGSNSTVYNYIGKLKPSQSIVNRNILATQNDLTVKVKMMLFDEKNTYNFKGDIFNIPANSVKYEISVSKWNFANRLSSLQILILTQNENKLDSCDLPITKVKETMNTESVIRRMNVIQDKSTLYAFYSDRLLVDGQVRYSVVENLNGTDSEKTKVDQSNKDDFNVLTAITIPFFETEAIVDPNYSALVTVEQNDSDRDTCSSKERKWLIPVVVVVVVVGAAAIALGVYIFLKKKYRYQFKMASYKLKKFSSSKKFEF
ncbi:hypothetical protein PPL_02258 [Heterostelium album PN500]|uniref:EGF-like domain-containing protein n=1 Tax=Heterostelium pallidum (strain ATCC 26659 / Pp 5 / PN500) TaxID=670386 RepID=D3B1T4_HETP5|nr:hypothetical protein PPL_02258 [Heterostelium album PN500]EFA85258.1 hypothetical protein PPL_02258 [Heterostelium album PN500]|eukprot:XP_020437367.1 hypothetical protein PPL_02258 [Heterostelium album PN500]